MNLHFIGKEFERLGKLEDIINYQYEPKSNKRLGKRNIYFEDLKLDFINEVNNLLAPDDPIETKDEHQLTRELRILALIRLGITDNKEIASILRASIATVYTYRSRLKARAINKDTFEDDIKRIQALS